MKKSNKHKALTLEERIKIEMGVRDGLSKSAIARKIGKDPSTVAKEIKRHRYQSGKCKMKLECEGYRHCIHNRSCKDDCKDYVPFTCTRRDRSPGVCTGCKSRSKCRFDKYDYIAHRADEEYRYTLKDAREGVNLTSEEAKALGNIIKPLLEQGQSPYQIIHSNPELGICEKTLYNYIEREVFEVVGIKNIDLRRKVGRRIYKKVGKCYKKRADYRYLKGRTYKDFQDYLSLYPNVHVMQMDTVYNDVVNGPFIQTFKFVKYGVMIALLHENRTSDAMLSGIRKLESLLGAEIFFVYAEVILTDGGSEFSAAEGLEERDGGLHGHVFYCDPMSPGQKGSLEENHVRLRYILPKECDLRKVGLTGQDALNHALSHINSAPVASLSGKSPLEYVRFMAPPLWEGLQRFGLKEIPSDEIVLRPSLLRPFRGA